MVTAASWVAAMASVLALAPELLHAVDVAKQKIFNRSVLCFQCCISFKCTAKYTHGVYVWRMYVFICIYFFQIPLHYRLCKTLSIVRCARR